jgi:hypothetical protein
MAAFNSTGSTLSSSSYEAALVEAAQLYRNYISAEGAGFVRLDISEFATVVTLTLSLPVSVSLDSDGRISFLPVDESIPTFSWVPGSEASAVSLPAQILALSAKINTGKPLSSGSDHLTLSIDTDQKKANISATFDLEDAEGGSSPLSFNVREYVENFT